MFVGWRFSASREVWRFCAAAGWLTAKIESVAWAGSACAVPEIDAAPAAMMPTLNDFDFIVDSSWFAPVPTCTRREGLTTPCIQVLLVPSEIPARPHRDDTQHQAQSDAMKQRIV